MIFVWVKKDNKDSQIFTVEMHAKFVERSNDVQSSQILAFLYMSENLVYQWQRIVISFDQSIELSIIYAKTQTFVFLFNEQDERNVWCKAKENELFVQMIDQILLYLLKFVVEHLIKFASWRCFFVDQLNLVIVETMRRKLIDYRSIKDV